MWIRKYDFNYGRRRMMESVAYGLGAGVLMPLDKAMALSTDSQLTKAYPDELMSIEAQTKGKVKVGCWRALKTDQVGVNFERAATIYDQYLTQGALLRLGAA